VRPPAAASVIISGASRRMSPSFVRQPMAPAARHSASARRSRPDVSAMTRADGFAARIRCVASIPSQRGITTSMSTMSGASAA
jgi:hypothetical protein